MGAGGKGTNALLADPDVRRWFENLARGSRATADVNLRRLAALCKQLRLTPASLAVLGDNELHGRLLDFVAHEESRGVAGSYIVRTLKAAKSWLLHHGRRLGRPIRVSGSKDSPSLKNERIPTNDELRKILLSGTPRIRAACALMAFSGLRPEVLGNYLGTDGLTISDLPDLEVKGGQVEFGTKPATVRVRPELSKNSTGYLTFLASEGCEYLKHYLEERTMSGELLGPDSDLIHPQTVNKRFIRTINIGDAIRTAIRSAGFSLRPYVLRHYFDTQLLTAESRGLVAHDFRVYWMGHTGSIDARYTTNKRQVPKVLVEEMREAYRRCEPLLSSGASRQSPPTQPEMLRTILTVMGYSDSEVAAIDESELTPDNVRELVKRRGRESASTERVVSVGELPTFLGEGWHFVSTLGASQAVIRHDHSTGSRVTLGPAHLG